MMPSLIKRIYQTFNALASRLMCINAVIFITSVIHLTLLNVVSANARGKLPTAAQTADVAQAEKSSDKRIIAKVADFEISFRSVQRLVSQRFPTVSNAENVSPEELHHLHRAAALGLVRRQLAMVRLLELGGPTLCAKIDRQIDRERKSLSRVDNAALSIDDRQEIAWRLAWNEYLAKHLTDENLSSYFQANSWKYDGTRALVSQIFLPFSLEAEQQLIDLKQLVESGEISFFDAAKQYSKAPSAADGGNLGWIQYNGDLPLVVAEAVLKTNPKTNAENAGAEKSGDENAIGPIRSPQGWHLLYVTEKRRGEKSFDEVVDRASIQRDAADYLFHRLVNTGYESATITWLDTTFKPPESVSVKP